MNRIIILITAAILFLPVPATAGVATTSGEYELLLESASLGGNADNESGDYELYSILGQPMGHDEFAASVYELFGGFLGVIDETPPEINISSPQQDGAAGGTIDVEGSVFDPNITQWTVDYGAGALPSRWAGLATGTANLESSSFVSWDASLYGGVYSARLTATDDRGNSSSVSVDFPIRNTLSINRTIEKHKWHFLSMPHDTEPSDPLSVFGVESQYKVYRWNPEKDAVQDAGKYEYPELIGPGTGYWLKVYNQDLLYNYEAVLTDTTGSYSVAAKEGWNQVGTPYNNNYPISYIQVKHGGQTYDIAEAVEMNLLSRTITSYDADINGWVQYGLEAQLEPYTGYNLRAYEDIELLFDPDIVISGSVPRQAAKIVRAPYEFRSRISASAGHSADPDNYFGVSPEASAEYDALDFEEPYNSPGGYYTSLYFGHGDWQRNAGRYANDVRGTSEISASAGDWNLTVETNETDQAVALSWDSSLLPSERYTFTLVDVESGVRTDMAAQDSYEYTAAAGGASSRSFRIEVRLRQDIVQVVKSISLEPGWNLVSVPLDPAVTNALAQLGDDLPMLNVYQFFDGRFYPASEADIQAGIGYWIYVDKNTEIDIEGELPQSVIRVPLSNGWNMIGNPYEKAIAWDDTIVFICGEERKTLSEAQTEGLVREGLYAYTGESYQPAETIEPLRGYLFRSNSPCELEISKP